MLTSCRSLYSGSNLIVVHIVPLYTILLFSSSDAGDLVFKLFVYFDLVISFSIHLIKVVLLVVFKFLEWFELNVSFESILLKSSESLFEFCSYYSYLLLINVSGLIFSLLLFSLIELYELFVDF